MYHGEIIGHIYIYIYTYDHICELSRKNSTEPVSWPRYGQYAGILEYVDRVAALPVPKLACKIRAFRQRHRSYANGKSVQDGAPKVAFSCLINGFIDIT